MRAPINTILAALGGIVLLAATATTAIAGGCDCAKPPSPPSPPNKPHRPMMPNISITVKAQAQASSSASASAVAVGAAGAAVFNGNNNNGNGGGGGGSFNGPGAEGFIQNLNVDSGAAVQRTAYEATRTRTKQVIIEVVCIDDLQVPHPGSQVSPDRDITDAYDGELYRCIAGTHLRATFADYAGTISFDHGWTLDCDKGQALYHAPGGAVACRAQIPARDCNERSLLRRFGAGIKILTLVTTERYTAYREDATQGSSSIGGSFSTDGGVGGIIY